MSKTQTILVENSTLLSMKQQGDDLTKTLLGLLIMPKITKWFKNNEDTIESIHKKMRLLQNGYYVVENGEIKKDEQNQPVFQEGKQKEEFEEKWNQLMKAKSPVKI